MKGSIMIFDAVLQVPHALCRLLYLCFFRCADCFIFAGDFDDKPSAASSATSGEAICCDHAGQHERARDRSMGVVGSAAWASIHRAIDSSRVAP